jgi:aminopeptidase N
MNNEYTRANGFVPQEYLGFGSSINNFHHSGGLNLRGYAGYLVPKENNGNIESFNYSGKSGVSINLEIDLSKYFHVPILNNELKTYIFGDAGIITNEDISFSNFQEIFTDVRADAGIGFTYTLKGLPKMKPLILRLDLPVLLNRPPANEDYIKMRWLIGINRVI